MKNVLTCEARKMFVAVCMVVMLSFGIVGQAQAAPVRSDGLVMYMGQNEMLAGNKKVSLGDSIPTLNNGRAYVPLRAVAENFGAKVNYDQKTGDITLKQGGKTVIMNTKASAFSINGELQWMDVAPYVNKHNHTMVPIRFISNGLGYELKVANNDQGTVDAIYIDRPAK